MSKDEEHMIKMDIFKAGFEEGWYEAVMFSSHMREMHGETDICVSGQPIYSLSTAAWLKYSAYEYADKLAELRKK